MSRTFKIRRYKQFTIKGKILLRDSNACLFGLGGKFQCGAQSNTIPQRFSGRKLNS